MLKCCSERCVCAPQSLSAGTLTWPRLSASVRYSAIVFSSALGWSTAFGPPVLGFGDPWGRMEPFRASTGAVHDGVAAVEPKRVIEPIEALAGGLVATVG